MKSIHSPDRMTVATVLGVGTTWQVDLVLEDPNYFDIYVITGPVAIHKGRMPETPEGFGSALNYVAAEVAGELREEFAEMAREKRWPANKCTERDEDHIAGDMKCRFCTALR